MEESAASEPVQGSPNRTTAGLVGVALLFAAGNLASVWLAKDFDGRIFGFAFAGALIFEPMALGIWTALGQGSILTRLPAVLPAFALAHIALCIAPENTRMEKYEFFGIAGVGLAIFVATALLFLIFRRFNRIQLQSVSSNSTSVNGFSFSIKSLLLLTTAYAVAMGLASQLAFRPSPPSAGPVMFGPPAVVGIMALIGGVVSASILPTLLVPLSILQGRLSHTALIASFTMWLVVTVAFTLMFDGPSTNGVLASILSAQVGAILAGAVTALLLRFAGLRLVRYDSRTAPTTIASPAPSP